MTQDNRNGIAEITNSSTIEIEKCQLNAVATQMSGMKMTSNQDQEKE